MQTIAIDIDDVLADNAKGFIEFSNQHWGTDLAESDYQEHWMDVWKTDLEETMRRAAFFHKAGVIANYAHREEALPVLKKLSESHKLVIVTSRRLSIQQHTQEWIHKHYPGVFSDERIHFAGIWDGNITGDSVHRTKAELCQKLGVDYLIDDQLKHCVGVAELGMQAILFGDYGWNQSETLPKGVKRVVSWKDIEEYFDGQ